MRNSNRRRFPLKRQNLTALCVQIYCPDISESKSRFLDKNNFLCVLGTFDQARFVPARFVLVWAWWNISANTTLILTKLWPKIILDPKFVCPIFLAQYFWTKKVLGQNFFNPNFFWTPNFFGPKLFWTKLFWTKRLFGHKFFCTQIFSGPKIYGTQNFLTQNLFGPKNFLDPIFLLNEDLFWNQKCFGPKFFFWTWNCFDQTFLDQNYLLDPKFL